MCWTIDPHVVMTPTGILVFNKFNPAEILEMFIPFSEGQGPAPKMTGWWYTYPNDGKMMGQWLVAGWPTPLKNMSSSVGMMIYSHIYIYIYIWTNEIHVPNHQPDEVNHLPMIWEIFHSQLTSSYPCPWPVSGVWDITFRENRQTPHSHNMEKSGSIDKSITFLVGFPINCWTHHLNRCGPTCAALKVRPPSALTMSITVCAATSFTLKHWRSWGQTWPRYFANLADKCWWMLMKVDEGWWKLMKVV